MAMGADGPAYPEGGPVRGIYRPNNKASAKPSSRPFEVKGITSQEAVEFAISYAKQQKALSTQNTFQAKTGPDRARTASGPEQDKHYHSVTKSQPRQLTADSPFAELEQISDSWTKQSFTGIRALPENLEHGFRQRALYETVMRGKQERQARLARSRSQPAMSASIPMLNGSPSLCASHYMPKASMRPSSWHIHSDTYGAWPYMSSEYSRERVLLAQQRKQSKELQVSEQDFVVPKTALPIRGQGCFSQLEYDLNPYPEQKKSKGRFQVDGSTPFYPPGKMHYPSDLLRGQFSRAECLAQLEQELTAAWPTSFLQVFENGASYVVVSFDAEAASEEGDVSGYMNELARLNSVPGSWQLCKSAPHWGLLQSGIIHFCLRPTWIASKAQVPSTLSGALPAAHQTN